MESYYLLERKNKHIGLERPGYIPLHIDWDGETEMYNYPIDPVALKVEIFETKEQETYKILFMDATQIFKEGDDGFVLFLENKIDIWEVIAWMFYPFL